MNFKNYSVPGDLYAEIRIVVPDVLTPQERTAYEALGELDAVK